MMQQDTEGRPTILFAIEPTSYRQAIGSAVQQLRPYLRIETVEPAALDREVACLEPLLVFANRPGDLLSGGQVGWVEFRPYGTPVARIRLNGHYSELEEAGLNDLLDLVDLAVDSAHEGFRARHEG